jgi:hypothetical protein
MSAVIARLAAVRLHAPTGCQFSQNSVGRVPWELAPRYIVLRCGPWALWGPETVV